jgi:cupin fold WbuC family metalloprotein
MIPFRRESEEVLYPVDDMVALSSFDLDELKSLASLNARGRIRLCTHRHLEDKIHEMFIVHTCGCYVKPHKHLGKIESISVVDGTADVVLFHDNGDILDVLEIGAYSSKKKFFYRLDRPVFHSLIVTSEFFVFHEVTEGPFRRETTLFPEWAPVENTPEHHEFIATLKKTVDAIKTARNRENGLPPSEMV